MSIRPIVEPEEPDDWDVGTASTPRLVGYRFTLGPEPGWTAPLLERWIDCRQARHLAFPTNALHTTDPLALQGIRTRVVRVHGAFVVDVRAYELDLLEALQRRSSTIERRDYRVTALQ